MRFEVYADTSDKYRWRLWSGSNKVAASGKSFASKYNAERAAEGFKAKREDCKIHNIWQRLGVVLECQGAQR